MKDALILVVESDVNERERMLRVLATCTDPSRVVAVPGADPALDYLLGRGEFSQRDARKTPRLLLLGLDGDAGLELLATVRITPHMASLPVVRLSPPATPRALQDQWYRAGANSVVGRTPDDAELERKLRQLYEFWITVNEADRHSRV